MLSPNMSSETANSIQIQFSPQIIHISFHAFSEKWEEEKIIYEKYVHVIRYNIPTKYMPLIYSILCAYIFHPPSASM